VTSTQGLDQAWDYLAAARALGLDPDTGEKIGKGIGASKPKENGNGSSAGVKVPEHLRSNAHPNETMIQLTIRLERERAEAVRQERLEYHDRLKRVHISIAKEHARKYDELEHRNGGGGG